MILVMVRKHYIEILEINYLFSGCLSDMEYQTCGMEISCDDFSTVDSCSDSDCSSGCFCTDGVMLDDGICILLDACPSKQY